MTSRLRNVPTRTCVGCGDRAPQAVLVRLQLDAAGGLVPAACSRGGRSAYIHPRRSCVESLRRTKRLRRALRRELGHREREASVDRLLGMILAECDRAVCSPAKRALQQ